MIDNELNRSNAIEMFLVFSLVRPHNPRNNLSRCSAKPVQPAKNHPATSPPAGVLPAAEEPLMTLPDSSRYQKSFGTVRSEVPASARLSETAYPVQTAFRRTKSHRPRFALALMAVLGITAFVRGDDLAGLVVQPPSVQLDGDFSQVQLIVGKKTVDTQDSQQRQDVTPDATYTSADPRIATVDQRGQIVARGNGETTIHVQFKGKSLDVPVAVTRIASTPQATFDGHIRPIISRLGCNAGTCHASQFGKGGFVLSVVGYDPSFDHSSMVRDRNRRRVNFLEPEESLLLKKPTQTIPHGGGKRLEKGSLEYQALLAWITAGAPGPQSNFPKVTGLDVFPPQRLVGEGERQQLRVVAKYADNTQRDVTHLAKYDSLDTGVVTVTPDGLASAVGRGQTAVMVRFEGEANIAMFVAPYGPSPDLANWKSLNFIDDLAARKFKELGIPPSPLCDDPTFLRRAFLDAIGTLPTEQETRAFLADEQPDKRNRLIDRLLGLTGDPNLDIYNDNYAAYWTIKWSDLLRNTTSGSQFDEQRMWAMHNWIKDSLRTNKPFDHFVRELVTAKGSIYSNGPASYFKIFNNSSELAESTAQLFLGIRLQCAKCHHHPFESYGQEDYYAFAAFFARVGNKTSQEFGLFGRETIVMVKTSGDVRHPKTGKILHPKALMAEEMDHPLDRRIPLGDWLTSPKNNDFSRNIANRYFAYLLGRGLVEPVDDLRGTNPPTNPELLDALARHFVESKFDLKQLLRTIMTSRLYQLDSQPLPGNMADEKFYSHYHVKRIAAEPLLDAIDQVTGVQTKFKSLPAGTRAIELPDGEYPDYFLNTFGKPKRVSVCECERMPDENLGQALHTLNGDILANKLADKNGRIQKLIESGKSDEEIIQELYLLTLCRPADNSEIATATNFLLQSPSKKMFYEDLLWSLINSKGFLFVQ
jgi:hypothetical protein